jgi:hypothetical protein
MGYQFISLCSQELWEAVNEILGKPPGFKPLNDPVQAFFKGKGQTLSNIFSAQRGELDERCREFEVSLYWLHDALGHWDELSTAYWRHRNQDDRKEFAERANDLAREMVKQLRRNTEVRRGLSRQPRGRDGRPSGADLAEPNAEFDEVCWTVAENVIVELERMWDGRRDFVDTAWSMFSLTRDLPAREAAPGTLKTLADSWLEEIFRRWKDETNDGTKPGPMDATLKRGRALVKRIEKLQRFIAIKPNPGRCSSSSTTWSKRQPISQRTSVKRKARAVDSASCCRSVRHLGPVSPLS